MDVFRTGILRGLLKKSVSLFLILIMCLMVSCGSRPHGLRGSDREYDILRDRNGQMIVALPNRMILMVQEVPVSPVVSVQVWVKTGSIYEQAHVGAGLSHFLEHLLAGGSTTTRSEQETNAMLGAMGAQTNAATGLDTVRYYINCTSDHTSKAIELLSDWMQNSLITQAEYDREREVIQREFEMGQGDPGRLFWKLTQSARYTAHPARHPTIGYLDEFLTISREEIYQFYRKMYVPNNMLFVVAGDIDRHEVIEQLSRLWSDQPQGALPALSLPEEPRMLESRQVEGYADISKPRLRLAFPGTALASPGDYELDLLSIVLGSGESSRLVRIVRDELRLVNSIDAYNLSFHWGEGFFGIDCELADEQTDIQAVTDAILTQVEALRQQPVTEEELARAGRIIESHVVQANQTVQGLASNLARDVIGTADPDYHVKYIERIRRITADQLQAIARTYLRPERLIAVHLLPQSGEQSTTQVRRSETEVDPSTFPQADVELDNRRTLGLLKRYLELGTDAVSPMKVDPVREYRLSNGLRLIVQRSTVVPAVAMEMYTLGGLLAESPGREGVTYATTAMMMRGTQTRSAQAIARAIEDLGAELSLQSGNNTTYVKSTALASDWPAVMALMADVVLHPSFPEQEWQKLQPRLLASIERQRDTWYGELGLRFRETYFGSHPWSQSVQGRYDVVASLEPSDLQACHRLLFEADETVMAVVGDVDPEQVRELVERYFSALPVLPDQQFDPPIPSPPDARVVQYETAKPLTAVQIGFGPGIKRDHPDYPALQVLSSVMSDFPSGWLEQQLRGEGPGLVYAVWAGNVVGMVPGYFTIEFNTSSEQVHVAMQRVMSVVKRAKTELAGAGDLSRAKAKVLTSELFSRQSNSGRATQAALDELYGVSDPNAEQFVRQVQRLTAEDLRGIARRYLVNPVIVVITDKPEDDMAF